VFVHETGAYAEGALAIEPVSACFPCAAGAVCHHLSCRQDFSPADIAAVVQFALGEGPQPTPARARILRATRVESGRLEYRPIWNPGNGDDEALRQAFGRMWEITLPGVSCDAIAVGTPERDVAGTAKADERAAALEVLHQLAGRAADLARRIPRAEGTRQTEWSAEVHSSLESAVRLGQLEPITQPIVGYLRTALESCAARDVKSISAVYCREWSNAARRAGILAELIAPRAEHRRASCGANPASHEPRPTSSHPPATPSTAP
jgi:hypothetical protein